MNNEKKFRIIVVLLAISIILSFITIKKYKEPRNFSASFENVLLVEKGKKVREVEISIEGELYKDKFMLELFSFEERLEGKVKIDNEEYYLLAANLGDYTDNIIWGDLRKNQSTMNSEYAFYLTDDYKKLYIRTIEDESEEYIYPVKSENDYTKIKKIMYGEINKKL